MEVKRTDRRTGPDNLIKVSNAIGNLSWVFVSIVIIFIWILVFFVIIFTQVINDPLKDIFGAKSLSGSNTASALIMYLFFTFLLLFIFSSVGLVINSFRHHRKTDTYNKSLIILAILSLAGLISRLLFM